MGLMRSYAHARKRADLALSCSQKVNAWFKVDVPGAGFNHDMQLTGKYAVLFDGSADDHVLTTIAIMATGSA